MTLIFLVSKLYGGGTIQQNIRSEVCYVKIYVKNFANWQKKIPIVVPFF